MSVCSVWVAGPLWVAWLAPYGAIHRGGGGTTHTRQLCTGPLCTMSGTRLTGRVCTPLLPGSSKDFSQSWRHNFDI